MQRIYVHFSSKDRQSIVPVVQRLRADGYRVASRVSRKEMPNACLWFVGSDLRTNGIPNLISQLDHQDVKVIPVILGQKRVDHTNTPTHLLRNALAYNGLEDYRSIQQTLDTLIPSSEWMMPRRAVPERRNRVASSAALLVMVAGLMACLLVLIFSRFSQPILQTTTPTLAITEATMPASLIAVVPSPLSTRMLTASQAASITPSVSLSPSMSPSTTPFASATITDTAIPVTLATAPASTETPSGTGDTHNTTGNINLILFPDGCPIFTSVMLAQLTPIGRSSDNQYIQFNAPGYFGAWTYAGNVLSVDLGSLPITLPPLAFSPINCSSPTPSANGGGSGSGTGNENGGNGNGGNGLLTPAPGDTGLRACVPQDIVAAQAGVQSNEAWVTHRCSQVFDGVEMVLVPGSTDNRIPEPFWVARNEVRVEDYVSFLNRNVDIRNQVCDSPRQYQLCWLYSADATTSDGVTGNVTVSNGRFEVAAFVSGESPVVAITFAGANAYCKSLRDSNFIIYGPQWQYVFGDSSAEDNWVNAVDMSNSIFEWTSSGLDAGNEIRDGQIQLSYTITGSRSDITFRCARLVG